MRVDGLIPADVKLASFFPQTMQRPIEPRIADLAIAQENFVNRRPAIAGSRTPHRDLSKVIPEIHEAHAEINGSMSRDTLSGNFVEEVGDAAIFFISAAGALGITPHEIETAIEERLATKAQLRLPIRRERRREFLREQLNALEITAAEITEIVEHGPDALEDTQEFNIKIKGRLMDGLHLAIAIGEAVDPGMKRKIVNKIDVNKTRFTETSFTMKGNEPPRVRYAIAYIQRKVQERKLSMEDALAKLQKDPDILAYGGAIDPNTLDLVEFS